MQEKHGILYFQTGVMQMLRTTAAVQRTKATFASSLSAAVFKEEDSHWGPHFQHGNCMTTAVLQMT